MPLLIEQQYAAHVALDSLRVQEISGKSVVGRMPRVFGDGVGNQFIEPRALLDRDVVHEMQHGITRISCVCNLERKNPR